MKLAYWNIRGLAQSIRFLAAYVGEELEEDRIQCGAKPTCDRSAWMDQKQTLGLDFPNLPYLVDGDVKLTQTLAIMNYIARKHGLGGKTPEEMAVQEMIMMDSMDTRSALTRISYNKDFENLKERHVAEVFPAKLAPVSKFLGEKAFLTGDKVDVCDFIVYETLWQVSRLDASIVDNLPNLKAYMDRFETIPEIKAYMASDKYMNGPTNNTSAAFGWDNK